MPPFRVSSCFAVIFPVSLLISLSFIQTIKGPATGHFKTNTDLLVEKAPNSNILCQPAAVISMFLLWNQIVTKIEMKNKIWKWKCISRKAFEFPKYGCINQLINNLINKSFNLHLHFLLHDYSFFDTIKMKKKRTFEIYFSKNALPIVFIRYNHCYDWNAIT